MDTKELIKAAMAYNGKNENTLQGLIMLLAGIENDISNAYAIRLQAERAKMYLIAKKESMLMVAHIG